MVSFFAEMIAFVAREPLTGSLWAMASHAAKLNNHRIVGQIGFLTAKMFDLVIVFVSEIVKPKAVGLLVHEGYQFGLQDSTLRRVQFTFKYRILHALAIVHALLGDLPQAFLSLRCFGIDIIGYEYQHDLASLPQKWRGFIQIRVGDLLLLPLLPLLQEGFSARIRQQHRSGALTIEVLCRQNTVIDEGQHESVGHAGA